MSIEWNYPGARWWKFDFHTHTPASKDTNGWQQAIGTATELTPEAWLLKYMEAEIDCVAITDHNSGAWVDKLKAAYDSMCANPPTGFRQLYLFPGVEISVSSGLHVLALFDINKSSNTITSLLGAVGFPDHLHGETNRASESACTSSSLIQVVEKIRHCGGIAIPAHVDNAKGLLQTKAETNEAKYADEIRSILKAGLLAVEVVDRLTPKPTIYTQAGLHLSEVVGSDCHSFQRLAVPGSRYTWVKMAIPSLEGLRLALLDGQEASIRRSDDPSTFSPFKLPEHFIESVEIVEARVMGRRKPTVLSFTPYFNALVGGRGTGKSTVVHALRLAYRRQNELETKSEAKETFENFIKVAKDGGGLRSDTKLTLTLYRDGVRYRLLWRQDGQGHAVEEWDDVSGSWKPSASQLIDEQRFPVRLFSQGQIASLAGKSQQALLQVIDKAAGTEEGKAILNDRKNAFFATRAKLRELKGKLKTREAVNVGLQDVQRKLARFEAAHHAEVLKAYQRGARQSRELDRQFETAREIVERMRGMAENLLAEDLPDGLFDPTADGDALSVVQKLTHAIEEAKTKVETAAQTLAGACFDLKNQWMQSAWQVQAERAKTDYEALKSSLQEQGVSDPSEYGRLVQERQRLDTESKRLDALQKQFDDLKEQSKKQLDQVWDARRAISDVRNKFLLKVLADNLFVHIDLIPYGHDAQAVERSLRDLLGAADGFKDDIYVEAEGGLSAKGLIADLLMSFELAEQLIAPDIQTSKEAAIEQLQNRLIQACRGSGDFDGRFNRRLVGEAEKRLEFIDHILCWFPEDGLQVEYSRKGDGKDFQSISQASAGQRAAAMLAFLLAYGNEPLVLDQPEDDLDNHLIYDLVVKQIRANKQRRQLIVVTHNPNIVVNGDAEMIYALDFNNQCHVKKHGSLQEEQMRVEICNVMEGGKDAFERRYQRLGRKV